MTEQEDRNWEWGEMYAKTGAPIPPGACDEYHYDPDD